MYQLTSQQVGFRISENDKEILNSVLNELQTEKQTSFSSFKDAVFVLIANRKQTENELISLREQLQEALKNVKTDEIPPIANRFQVDFSENTAVQELIGKVIENESLPVDSDVSEVVSIALSKALKPPTVITETIEKEVEVEVSVPTPLKDGEVILSLKPMQRTILEIISKRRFEAGYDSALQTIETTADRLIFNKATLFNWGGEFSTCLKLGDFK